MSQLFSFGTPTSAYGQYGFGQDPTATTSLPQMPNLPTSGAPSGLTPQQTAMAGMGMNMGVQGLSNLFDGQQISGAGQRAYAPPQATVGSGATSGTDPNAALRQQLMARMLMQGS